MAPILFCTSHLRATPPRSSNTDHWHGKAVVRSIPHWDWVSGTQGRKGLCFIHKPRLQRRVRGPHQARAAEDSRRLCIPNLHPISWSLLPSAKTGVIYVSTAHSRPDDSAENWVSSSCSTACVVGQEKGHWGKLAAYTGTSPWHRHQREVAGVKRKHVETQTLDLWSLARDLGHWVWSGTYGHQLTQWPRIEQTQVSRFVISMMAAGVPPQPGHHCKVIYKTHWIPIRVGHQPSK